MENLRILVVDNGLEFLNIPGAKTDERDMLAGISSLG